MNRGANLFPLIATLAVLSFAPAPAIAEQTKPVEVTNFPDPQNVTGAVEVLNLPDVQDVNVV